MVKKIPRKVALTFKLMNPLVAKLVLANIIALYQQPWKNQRIDPPGTLTKVAGWLLGAKRRFPGGGISNGFHLGQGGWQPPHVETTGYTITTLFDLFHYLGEVDFKSAALEMADWIVHMQLENGSFPSRWENGQPVTLVFDTGQILQGLLRAYEETENQSYLRAAIRAGDWLLSQQDLEGSWKKNVLDGIEHSYHTRVAWPLLQLSGVTNNQDYQESGERCLEWASQQLTQDHWLKKTEFFRGRASFTHTIAYAIQGFIEGGLLLKNQNYLEKGQQILDRLLEASSGCPFMPGEFRQGWRAEGSYSCLTGNAQTALCCLRLYEVTGKRKYLVKSQELNTFVASTLLINGQSSSLRGAVAGSFPIYGKYIRLCFPVWAAKFFVEALLAELKIGSDTGVVSKAV